MKAQDKMNEIVEKIIKSIENDTTGIWTKSWVGGGLPLNYASKTTYSGFNILSLLLMQDEMNWTTSQYLTFNQIKKIKGAKLKKGSKSTPVFFFKILEKKEEKNGVKKIVNIPLLKFYYVFNLDQIEGIEIGSQKQENSDLNDFVNNCDVDVRIKTEAYYSPIDDYIGIPSINMFNSVEAYASTILHELSHSTGHKDKLNRNLSAKFGSESYAREECIVELSNMFLCNHLSIKNEANQSEAYIKNWLVDSLKAEPKMLWKLASESQKIFNYLLSLQDKQIQQVA